MGKRLAVAVLRRNINVEFTINPSPGAHVAEAARKSEIHQRSTDGSSVGVRGNADAAGKHAIAREYRSRRTRHHAVVRVMVRTELPHDYAKGLLQSDDPAVTAGVLGYQFPEGKTGQN